MAFSRIATVRQILHRGARDAPDTYSHARLFPHPGFVLQPEFDIRRFALLFSSASYPTIVDMEPTEFHLNFVDAS